MKIINLSFIKKIGVLSGALLIVVTSSCESESPDIVDPGPVTEVSEELSAEIAKFAGTSEKVYKLRSAQLTNESVTDLDITSLFNVKDDEFVFSTEGNGDLELAWHEGFGFNTLASTVNDVRSDTRASSKFKELVFNEGEQRFETSGYSFTSEDNMILGTLTMAGGASLMVELTQKTAQDYLQPPTSLNAITELFSTTNGSAWSGFKGSIAQDALFLTNYNSPVDDWNVSAFRFDLSTNELTTFIYNQEDHPWINLEIINDRIYNVGGSFYQEFDFDFNGLLNNEEITNSIWDFGSAAQDDEIYLFSGYLSSTDLNEVGKYNITDGNVDIIGSLPSKKSLGDGEIVNNKLYIFGGIFGDFAPTYDNFVFDLSTGDTEIVTSTTKLGFTSTSVVENLVYIGGMKSEDFDNDGIGDSFDPHLEVFNIINNTSTEIALNFDMLENERLYKLWATEDFIYFVLTQNQDGGSANLRVVRAPLN